MIMLHDHWLGAVLFHANFAFLTGFFFTATRGLLSAPFSDHIEKHQRSFLELLQLH